MQAPNLSDRETPPTTATAVFDEGYALWLEAEKLGFEGIFFSEHHFGLSYSPSPNLLIAAIARSTERLRLGTMGMVLPLYQPWRVLEEIGQTGLASNPGRSSWPSAATYRLRRARSRRA